MFILRSSIFKKLAAGVNAFICGDCVELLSHVFMDEK
ncbi:MAG: hypothetical protein HZY79_08205 [Rhodoblastus sp.]|nr:MAG: hypothetical protein HZY79_08205 [Rhodoblastus sp.]